ncbi:multidrug efflux MFS transporter [Leuconostoc lactis]|uniref:Multidrug efflux MFS transporter n=1 Tax=Leuconostoc lactis TaxID=1246 RepID=A0AAP9JAD9_LEULA|nr:MFS transporter [Leuconostoc lactis]MBA5812781.1 MFS transporter [Leuconostoc lactis]MCC2744452.1 MFS transporter [Leuconostoc lactis]MCC2754990.1 MFS transporter [Leuconostoc lactis]QEA44049.1 multidrug efflux MFS transporter [Leuconostoc lactis]
MFKNIRQLTPFAIILLAIAFTMSISQSTMTTAYPVLMRNFQVDAGTVQWLTTGFMVAMTLVMPVSPWLLNNVTLRTLLNGIVAVFLTGTAVAMLATRFEGIIIGRLLEGLAVGALFPTFQSVILENTATAQRGVTMGVVGLVMGSALAVGPIISGVVLQWVSWRALFVLFFVILLGLIAFGQPLIQNTHVMQPSRFDWLSALSLIGFGGVLYAISSIETLGMNWLWWAILLGSFCLLTLFVIRQRQLAQPFLDLSVLRYRGYIPGLLLTGISYSGLIIATVIMPLFYQRVFNITPMWSGLLMVPAAVFLSQLNPRTGRLLNQIGLKKLVYIGMAMMMVGYAGLALFGTQSWVVGLLAALLLEGGNAFVMMPAVTAANNVLPESLVSHGTALITTMRQVIGAASVVVATLLISHFNTTVTIGQALSRTSAWFILVPVAGVLLATQLKRHEGD